MGSAITAIWMDILFVTSTRDIIDRAGYFTFKLS